MPALGLAILSVLLSHLALALRTLPARRPFPWFGWAGLAVLAVGALALILRFDPLCRHITPWMWTGFILFVDGLLHRLDGRSLVLGRRGTLVVLLPLSILFWVAFEAYNLRLANWEYVNLPDDLVHRYAAYAWSFSTILPALFLSAELYFSACFRWSSPCRPWRLPRGVLPVSVAVGLLFLVAPPLFPSRVAQYLFGFVWLGVILTLDPINYRLGRRSLWRDVAEGNWARVGSLWWGGVLCGLLWEFWNYWAEVKWIYVFPILQGWKVFEMPLPGYLGFPFFAMECFVFCEFVLGGTRFGNFASLEAEVRPKCGSSLPAAG